MVPKPGRNVTNNVEIPNTVKHDLGPADLLTDDKMKKRPVVLTPASDIPERSGGRTSSEVLITSSKISSEDAVSYINPGEEDQMEIYGYRRSYLSSALTWFLIVATVGILRMVFHWFPELFLKCTHSRCSLENAERVLVVEIFQKKYRRVHIRDVINETAFEAICSLTDPLTKKKCGSELLQGLGLPDEALTVSMPNDDGTFREVTSIRMFTCKKLRYFWNANEKRFVKLKSMGPGMSTASLHQPEAQIGMAGLSRYEQLQRRVIYGYNHIHVPVKSVMQLLLLEVLNPFYIFQVASVIIWICIYYYSYAAAIFLMSGAGIIITIVQTRKNQRKLRDTVRESDIIEVCRGGGVFETIRTEELVPGDIIVIPSNGITMYCDAVLLFGTCIVNESTLTGESVPVTKTPLPQSENVMYHVKEHARHTLYSGTKVVQTRFYNDEKVMAIVTSTGFMTAKGSLVSSIMYPPPVDFRFERDSYRFVGFLAAVASVGFAYSIISKVVVHGETGAQVILHSFDMITVCVPPALPAAMTAGIILAQKRLKLKNIFCISPRSINVSGSLNCVCFDKTGTLTEDGLDLWGVIVALKNRFLPPIKIPSTLPQAISAVLPPEENTTACDPPLLMIGMATCHSLTIIDNKLSGDPLDLKMFESSGWSLEEPSKDDAHKFDNLCPTIVSWDKDLKGKHVNTDTTSSLAKVEVGIVRQFTFSSSLQRMSVICKRIGREQELHFFCKGSPEMLKSLSNPETVPENFDEVLQEYTKQGFRVIALAHRLVEIRSINKIQKIQREELEHDLTFLGLVVLENRLKPDTAAVISQLSQAAVRTIMVTGDNILTAISVARDCGMVGGINDQVVIVNYDESAAARNERPELTFTLAHRSSILDLQRPSITYFEPLNHGDDTVVNMTNLMDRHHLAMTGKCWAVLQQYYPELVPRCVVKGTIFARMSPEQKQQLVQELQQLSYYVGMCGDGANDCGALKAAHAGIALSDTEASVASPFTSREPSISCVPELIRQGRCSLVTSFGIFKYMAIYSMIQFISVVMLYEMGVNLTDNQFLYADLFIICILSAVFGYTQPYEGPLFHRPPLMSLFSLSPIGSLLLQTAVIAYFQVFSYLILTKQDWYVPYMDTHDVSGLETGELACHENYAVFCVSMSQYIFLALAYAKGKPYRRMFITNYWFVGALVACTGFSIYVMIEPAEPIRDWLELEMPPMYFRLIVLGLSAAQVVACLLIEAIVVDHLLVHATETKFWKRLRPSKEKYLAVEQELDDSPDWPPIHSPDASFTASDAPPVEPKARPPFI